MKKVKLLINKPIDPVHEDRPISVFGTLSVSECLRYTV